MATPGLSLKNISLLTREKKIKKLLSVSTREIRVLNPVNFS